jgi:hypothetical protein
MKTRIADPEMIRKQERDLFEALSENLDRSALSRLFSARHRLSKISSVHWRSGDLVALPDAVAYRLDFDVRAELGVVFDRHGNYQEIEADILTPVQPDAFPEPDSKAAPSSDPAKDSRQQPDRMPEETEIVGLEQIVYGRSDMIEEAGGRGKGPPKAPPGERISEMAAELAGMISDINGKKKR